MIKSNNNNSHNKTNIVQNNTIYRVQLGSENVADNLSHKEQMEILNKIHTCLFHYVYLIHFSGKHPECMNVALTNLRSKFAYKYSEEDEKFITDFSYDIFTNVFDTRLSEVSGFYDAKKGSLTPKVDAKLVAFFHDMKNNPGKYKKVFDDILVMAYNNRYKVDMQNCANLPEDYDPYDVKNRYHEADEEEVQELEEVKELEIEDIQENQELEEVKDLELEDLEEKDLDIEEGLQETVPA